MILNYKLIKNLTKYQASPANLLKNNIVSEKQTVFSETMI